ncbi:response regulator transcription factor [Phycicoccus flavus]|uniref:response regulator transcription factor n=1 Tax=Phycicoccus flavus TaxID=2502783 RepID=UPI00197B2669|nr:helix-turn-helix transcriptional regulator [Phycicoccus flavus]
MSEREAEVLTCYAVGSDAKAIASQLHLSQGTVRNYLASATTKLDARNRVDAIRIDSEAGWIQPGRRG